MNILFAFQISMCDKSRNTWLCVHWQWNTLEWCQLNALQASPVVHLVTPLSCVSLSMNTQPNVPAIEIACPCQKSMPNQVISYFYKMCYILPNECNACHRLSKLYLRYENCCFCCNMRHGNEHHSLYGVCAYHKGFSDGPGSRFTCCYARYCQSIDMKCTFAGNEIAYHSDVVGAVPTSWSIACGYCSNYILILDLTPVASFTKEVDPRLAKCPLNTNGHLANRRLTSLVKEDIGLNGLGEGNCKTRWERYKFGHLVHLILEIWLFWSMHAVYAACILLQFDTSQFYPYSPYYTATDSLIYQAIRSMHDTYKCLEMIREINCKYASCKPNNT